MQIPGRMPDRFLLHLSKKTAAGQYLLPEWAVFLLEWTEAVVDRMSRGMIRYIYYISLLFQGGSAMGKWIRFGAAALLTALLCVLFGNVLLVYSQPMQDTSYDLSMNWEGESQPADWVYDQKGWTVFTQEGETITELTPDGLGGFFGLEEPGQTFYFSRVITETLDSPTLLLDAADRTFAVFLDGTPLYTDHPELDNRIGHLRLPSLDHYREERLLVKLPLDCAGKTLTIAQSSYPVLSENSGRVYPCAVTLYCGYAYESGLISESFQSAIPSALSYAAGLVLLALFLWQAFQRRLAPGTLCGAAAAFSHLTACIIQPSFRALYFELPLIDAAALCRHLTLLTLLALLLCKMSGWRRRVLGGVTVLLGGLSVVNFVLAAQRNASIPLILWHARLGAGALLLALVLGCLEWRRDRRQWFFRLFCPLVLAGTAACAIVSAVSPSHWTLPMFLHPLTGVTLAGAFLSAVTEWVHGELTRRTEARLLLQRSQLAQNSYAVMRQQNEQVMMLRHDMMHHFQLLRQTTADAKTAAYLDELMGQNETIRPVVQSGNEMLDIILNGKLSAAADAGIAVEIIRMEAPPVLSLSDAELSSLLMNLLDNAVEAAAAPGVARPYIKLDLCIKEHFFMLLCENAATMAHIQKESAPGHGLGLKIIRQIAARHDNLLETEYGEDFYRVKLAIPLD